ncbi:MAG: zinc metallopeptidase, partial [Oscillospiraceae bacterium]|nr:zinc metallopeptidase [Oscillospiraceae bacterium]
LPVEFSASNRALAVLEQRDMLSAAELKGTKKVLSAAAMTYVAALVTSLAQLLRLIMVFGGRRRNN